MNTIIETLFNTNHEINFQAILLIFAITVVFSFFVKYYQDHHRK